MRPATNIVYTKTTGSRSVSSDPSSDTVPTAVEPADDVLDRSVQSILDEYLSLKDKKEVFECLEELRARTNAAHAVHAKATLR